MSVQLFSLAIELDVGRVLLIFDGTVIEGNIGLHVSVENIAQLRYCLVTWFNTY